MASAADDEQNIRMGEFRIRKSDPTSLHDPLGRLVYASSMAEVGIRRVFCALLDSKYAAVIAGGKMMNDLIQMCTAIVKAHKEMSEVQRADLLTLLQACGAANRRRNRLIHDQLGMLGSQVIQIRSKHLSHRDEVAYSTLEDIEQTINEIVQASGTLIRKVIEVLGDDAWYRTFQLQFDDAQREHLADEE